MKINHLEIENTKRVRAVAITPSKNGLTILGGRNGQGKTSVLDAITWALGGEKYRPTNAARDGSVLPPKIRIELDNGIVVERKGKNSALTVTDPTGVRSGQRLLDEFVSELALNLPKFLGAPPKEKAQILLQIIGVGDQLDKLDAAEKAAMERRRETGNIARRKKALAEEMESFEGVPEETISAGELIARQQAILRRNAERQAKRDELRRLQRSIAWTRESIRELEEKTEHAKRDLQLLLDEASGAEQAAGEPDEPTDAIERDIARIEQTNEQVRANETKRRALDEAKGYEEEYAKLTNRIEQIRQERIQLLEFAKLPLPELGIENGELIYKGKAWDCMSGAEQMIVGTAIVQRLKPECAFVLLDKLEQLDEETLQEFDAWLTAHRLQAIATRVSRGKECQIIIEDGMVAEDAPKGRFDGVEF